MTDFSRLRTGRSNGAIPTRKAAVQAISDMGPVVYALQQGDTIKIGWTSNLSQRIHSLGAWRLIGFKLDGTRAVEGEIHRSLDGHAIKGREWYPHDDPSVVAVVNEMRAEVGLSPL